MNGKTLYTTSTMMIEQAMDTVGGVMYVEYKNGEVRECQK